MRANQDHLPYFIDEVIYLLKDKPGPAGDPQKKSEVPPRVLVVVDSAQTVKRSRQKDSFLARVLGAVAIKMEEILIQTPEEFNKSSLSQFKWVLFFGVRDLPGVPEVLYQVETTPSYRLSAESLSQIESERERKAKLWSCLQQMFQVES